MIGKASIAVAVALTLAACGGNRMAQPVAMVQPTDGEMACDVAQFEMLSNQTKIQTLYSEIDKAQDDRTRNMIFGGLIGYATSEDGSAARAEIGALQARNNNLMMIQQRNGCWSGGKPPASTELVNCRVGVNVVPRTRADCQANGGTVI